MKRELPTVYDHAAVEQTVYDRWLTKKAFAAIPEANSAMRNSVAVLLGTISYMEGDFAGVMRYSQDALERDNFMTAEMAKDFGLIDKILEKRAEPIDSK